MKTRTTRGITFLIKKGTSICLEEGHIITEQTIKELHLGFEYERQRCEEEMQINIETALFYSVDDEETEQRFLKTLKTLIQADQE